MSEASEEEFKTLIEQVRGGSQEAAWDLFQRYSPQILRIIRRKLPDIMRQKFDSDDFVQATWASIFANRDKLLRFHAPAQFVAFVAAVASNKVGMEVRRRLLGQKFNTKREQSLDDSAAPHRHDAAARQDTPSQIAVARERWFRMLEGQPDHYQEMVKLRYSGESYQEVADRLGVDERTVRRAIRKILRDMGDD